MFNLQIRLYGGVLSSFSIFAYGWYGWNFYFRYSRGRFPVFLGGFPRARRSLFNSPVYRATRRVLFQTPRCAENRDNLIFEKVQGSSIGRAFEVNGAYEMDTEAESRGLVRVHVRVGG